MKSVSSKERGKPTAVGAEPRKSEIRPRLASVREPEPRASEPARSQSRPGDGARPVGERRVAREGDEPRTGVVRRVDAGGWRCLEWKEPGKQPRRRRAETSATKVTIVQLTAEGELLRQDGPDGWLPEAGDFTHRMSTLLARTLGFAQCRSLCLKNQDAVLAVSSVGNSKVVAVSGPTRSLANVLRRAGLQ